MFSATVPVEPTAAAEWPPPIGTAIRSDDGRVYFVIEHRDNRQLGEHVVVRRTLDDAIELRPITRPDWIRRGYRRVRG